MDRSPIPNGAVLVSGDSIVEAARYQDLKAFLSSGVQQVEHGAAALAPALVNAHTHLELSFLQGRIPLPQRSFADWLENLFSLRVSASRQEQLDGSRRGRWQVLKSGAGLYADTSNEPGLDVSDEFPARHIFREILGFDQYDLQAAVASDIRAPQAAVGRTISLAAHACYSTSASLIQQAKAWCREHRLPFSIHVAEHGDEIEFLQTGSGYCRELLQRLGRWTPGWRAPHTSPVQYLDSLGVLDRETLLVHAVHMRQTDWETVAGRGCAVCFCPRSNHNLNVGRADIEKSLRYGIPACLGTDSLASNSDLDLFAEAVHLLNHHPKVSPDAVFFMMTHGGARALKQAQRFGSLARGRHSTFLSINLPGATGLSRLSETLIHQGHRGEWKWVNCLRNN